MTSLWHRFVERGDSSRRGAIVQALLHEHVRTHAPTSEEIYAEMAERFGVERVTQLFTLLHELQDAVEEIAQEQDQQKQRTGRKPAGRARKSRAEP